MQASGQIGIKTSSLNSRQVTKWKCNNKFLKGVIKCLSLRQCHASARETGRHANLRVSPGSVRPHYSVCVCVFV